MIFTVAIEAHLKWRHLPGRGLVHVIPNPGDAARHVARVEFPPPSPRLCFGKIGERRSSRPHLANVDVARVGLAEQILAPALVEPGVARLELHAWVHDG